MLVDNGEPLDIWGKASYQSYAAEKSTWQSKAQNIDLPHTQVHGRRGKE